MIKQTLYVSQPSWLSLWNEQIKIEQKALEKDAKSIINTLPAEDIGFIILENPQITITHQLLGFLAEKNIAIVVCNQKRMPNGLMLGLEGNHLQNKIFNNQIEASLPTKKRIWQQLISKKIENQGEVLKKYGYEATNMKEWSKEVKSGDPDNLEGRAAAYYWRTLSPNLNGIENRDPDNNDANLLLNYGYAILRAIVARSLIGSGLLPTFGVHHHNQYNAYALADDVMEPYRPFVDIMVIEICKTNKNIEELTREMKQKLMLIGTEDVEINGSISPLMVACQRTTSSLKKIYDNTSETLVLPNIKLRKNEKQIKSI